MLLLEILSWKAGKDYRRDSGGKEGENGRDGSGQSQSPVPILKGEYSTGDGQNRQYQEKYPDNQIDRLENEKGEFIGGTDRKGNSTPENHRNDDHADTGKHPENTGNDG